MDNIDDIYKQLIGLDDKYTVIPLNEIRKIKVNEDIVYKEKKSANKYHHGILIHKNFFTFIIKIKKTIKTIEINKHDFYHLNSNEKFMKYLIESIDNDNLVESVDNQSLLIND